MAREIPLDEFRRNNNKKGLGHPAYIYAQVGDEFKFIGITHAEITNNMKNIPLDVNPNPEDSLQSYALSQAEKSHKASFGKKLKGWRLSDSDKEKIKNVKK